MLSAARRLAGSAAGAAVLAAVAVVLVAVALVGAPPVAVALLAVLVVGGVELSARMRPSPVHVAVEVMALVTLLAALTLRDGPVLPVLVAGCAALAAAALDVPLGHRLAPVVSAVRLPGAPSPDLGGRPFGRADRLVVVSLALLLLAGAESGVGPWLVLGVAAVVLGIAGASLVRAVRARRTGTADDRLTAALEDYAPEFYVHYTGPADGAYQVGMWLPFLERIGRRYAVLTRDPALLRERTFGDAPMVASPRLAGLDSVMVPSVSAVFYVNTHHLCVDPVRYLDRVHVHLNHGDSDKPSSYHPMIAMFDQVFVAGQAAVDRFASHGVAVPESKFRLVGRPQVADIRPANEQPDGWPTLLYAPTWRGGVRDMNLGSLVLMGEQILEALLRTGARVAFRPHPFSRRDAASAAAIERCDGLLRRATADSGPAHLTSADTAAQSAVESLNLADALVTDVSSLASDFLYSGKPMAITRLAPGLEEEYPVMRAAYPLDPGGDLDPTLALMLGPDPLAGRRRELRTAYLGPVEVDDYADVFVAAAVRAINEGAALRR